MGIFSAMEIIAEQRIAEATERGEFENLPGMGKPLILEDDSHVAPELRMAWKILKNANCLPPELAERKEMGNIADLLDNCADAKEKLRQMRKLRIMLDRISLNSQRSLCLEENDEYYQKILARLERHERNTRGDTT